MFKFSFLSVLIVILFSVNFGAQARNLSPCGRSYFEDSVGRGIEVGYRSTGGAPRHLDSVCYNAGRSDGESLKKKSISGCDSTFNQAFDQGKNGDFQPAGDECTTAGFQAGRAWLRSQARERNRSSVGDSCVNAYEKACQTQVDESQSNLKDSICYHTGLGDILYVQECAAMKK